MSWRAGTEAEGAKGSTSKKSVYMIIGGLVVAGIAATWNWLRKLPK